MVFLMLSLVEPEPFITLNSNHEKQNSFSIESLQCTCFTVDIISIKSCKMLHVENNLANQILKYLRTFYSTENT